MSLRISGQPFELNEFANFWSTFWTKWVCEFWVNLL